MSTPCGCYSCNETEDVQLGAMRFQTRMYVCDICGNKRCPHATDHVYPCSGSNESNQLGSRYQYAPIDEPRPSVDELWERITGIERKMEEKE